MSRYRTQDGDRLDLICKRHYGSESYIVDILLANPSVAEHGEKLPVGVILYLPDLPAASGGAPVRLWD